MIRLKCKWPGYLRQADCPGCVSRMSESDKNLYYSNYYSGNIFVNSINSKVTEQYCYSIVPAAINIYEQMRHQIKPFALQILHT
jgi:hypothetical protein